MGDNRRARGAEAEDRAANYLLAKGYTLVTRRFACRDGEIDLVALDGETLVFVEVRARGRGPLRPEETLTPAKLRALDAAAREYLRRAEGRPLAWRFDLVAVEGDKIRHHPGAIVG